MTMPTLAKFIDKKLIQPPKWLPDNLHYLTLMGSVAYGVKGEDSDWDVHGFCIPPLRLVFPYTSGEIPGFGNQIERFNCWQQHHIADPDGGGRTFDFNVYSIVSFFHLAMQNNPNVLDALFVPRRCILHSTPLSEHMRKQRRMFLHKGAMDKLRGYASSQMNKIRKRQNASNPKRAETIEKHGYDTKFAYHVVRLMLQLEEVLTDHDLHIDRHSQLLIAIRRGDWTLEHLEQWHQEKEIALERICGASTLRDRPDEEAIKALLFECLEMHYGRLDQVISKPSQEQRILSDLRAVLDRYGG